MKKTLLSLITITFFLCEALFTGGGTAFAFDAGTYYTYTIISSVDKTVSVKWKSGTSPETITIPSTVTYSSTTYKVIAVEDNAFKNCTTAATITIGSNVKTIGSSAFNGCSNVTSINFGSGTSYPCNVDTIKGSAFSSCSKLATINCYGGIEKWLAIGFNAGAAHPFTANSDDKTFKINNTAITEIEVPSTVTKIKKYAFYKNTALTSITIGTGVTSIGSYAFNGCSNLTTIKFGKSTDEPCNVDTIMDNVFTSCIKVNKVYCYGGIEKWLAIKFCNNANGTPYGASTQTTKYFYLDGSSKTTVDISGTQVKPYAFYKSPVSTVNIGASVQTIGTYAFYGSKLTNLNFTNDSELTRIGANAFASCTSLKTPTLPTSLERIDGNAFNGCTSTNFKSITIPVNVTVCGDGVFTGCSNLNSVVWNAANCTTYDGTNPYKSNYGPFYNTTLKPQITFFTFGDAVEVIPMFCCYNMTNLSSVTIPASVTSIGEKAFSGCTGLSIIIAKPVDPSDCGTNAFESVTKTIPVRLTSATSISAYQEAEGWSEFEDISNILSGSCGTSAIWTLNLTTGVLEISGTGAISNYTSGSPAPWYDYIAYISDIVINSGITTLGERCFESCDVETCTIPASVTNFESQSFLSAKANKLYYSGTLSNWCAITMGAYNTLPQTQELYINSSKITSLTLPAIASLGTKAFMNMKGITSVTIPASLTTIGADAFSGCSNLADVYFQGTLAQWCAISFSNDQEANPAYNGAALHIDDSDIEGTVMVVKDAITSISNYAFCGVNNYTSIEINAETTIGTNTFKNCTAQILYRGSASGTSGNVSWTWEDGVLTLTGTGTMNNYTATPSAPWSQYMASTTSIIVGEGITSLGDYAFYATAAPSITLSLPSTLTSIGKSVGYGLKDLRILVIPDAVTTIGTSAFSSCTNLEKIYCPATRPTLNKDYGAPKYTNFPTNKAFYVTASSYSSQYAGQWTNFTPQWHIEGDCGAEGDNVQYDLNITTGTLTISGTGAMADYNTLDNRAPWYDLRSDITSIKICDGVTHVGKYAFNGCSSATEVWMSTTVTGCGASAFLNCSGLTKVKYGRTGSTILSYATDWAQIEFANYQANPLSFAHVLQVYKATSTIPAFSNVTSLENRNISAIKPYAFYGCTTLTNAVLPANVETIGGDAFYGCTNLSSVTLPDALTTIGKEAFKNCSTLTSITIPENVMTMTCHNGSTTYSIFGGCTNLTTIVWNARNCASDYIKVGTGSGYNYGTPFSGIYSQITSITFGENVERIPNFLCYHMDHLTSVTIPASVTNIGTEAFDACSGTMSVICEGATPPTLSSGAFSSPSTKKLYLPHDIDVKAAYRAASGWSSFTEENTYPKIVQFDLNGKSGTIPDPQFFDDKTSKAAAPATPADDGYYTFDQWTTDASGASPFMFASTNITADLTLYAKWTLNGLVLNENSNNSAAITAYNGLTTDVSMIRSLTNVQYNTFCLPFSLSAEVMTEKFGAGYDLEELTGVAYNAGELTLEFTKRDELEAGKPYLLQPVNIVENPSFAEVTISNAAPSDGLNNAYLAFHGIYSPTELEGGNHNLLFLGAGNELFWPATTGSMKGFRGYFEIKSPALAAVRARIVKKEDAATGIEEVRSENANAVRSEKILRSGQLLILRDGKTYNAQGMLVE